jgi:O-antigen/teichoic acid export membrane protein
MKSTYFKNVLTLLAGTGLAQLAPILVSPVLTRIYGPTDLGVLAFVSAASAILAVLVTGRYELAIVLPERDSEAFRIALVSWLLTCCFSAAAAVLLFIFNRQLQAALPTSAANAWLFVVPVSAFLTGLYQTAYYWCNRDRQYRQMSVSRLVQNYSSAGLQVMCGYSGFGAGGLLAGQLAGQAASASLLLGYARKGPRLATAIRPRRLWRTAQKYAQFPKYLIVGQLANVASAQMPMILLTTMFGPAVGGFYALAQRTLSVPMTLVGGAIGDVYRSEASREVNAVGNCANVFRRTFVKLAVLSAVVTGPLVIFSPSLFQLVFGPEWREAGRIAAMLAAMLFFQTISSPLSQTVLLGNMQQADMVWQLARLVCAVLSLYVGAKWFESYTAAIALFATAFSMLYVIHSVMQYKAARRGTAR